MAVSGAENLRQEMGSDHYQKLLFGDINDEIVQLVKTDLHRTYPDNIYFNGADDRQRQLCNILVAYAHDNMEVGYCQVSFTSVSNYLF